MKKCMANQYTDSPCLLSSKKCGTLIVPFNMSVSFAMFPILIVICCASGLSVVSGLPTPLPLENLQAKPSTKCSSTLACEDPGEICSNGHCICIVDTNDDALAFWGCDDVLDCEGPIRFAADELSYAGLGQATDTLNLEEPACRPSTNCANPPGKFGYCDVFWPDGDAL